MPTVAFTINIKSDGAALAENPRLEIITALSAVARQVIDGFDAGSVRDSNGALIGAWSIVAPR